MAGTIIVNSARTDASNVFTIKTATGDNMLQVGVGGLAASTITTAMLADNSVTAAKIAPGTIVDSDIGNNAVTTAKIADDAVTVAKVNLISTSSVPSLEAKGTSGSTSGYIQLNCSENSHGIKLLGPPHSAAANYTLTLPNNDGDANQFLQTNGSGVTSWATVASTPENLVTNRTVTGSVAAREATCLAADGTIGVYPTINSLGSNIAQTQGVNFMDGFSATSKLRMVTPVLRAGAGNGTRAVVYGSYINGSGVWTENSTPLNVDMTIDAGDTATYTVMHNTYPKGLSSQANTWSVLQGVTNATQNKYWAQVTAVVVNPTTGAPSIEGTASNGKFQAPTSGVLNNNGEASFDYNADGYYKVRMITGAVVSAWAGFRYTPGSGYTTFSHVNQTRYDYFTGLSYAYYTITPPPGFTQINAAGTRLWNTTDASQSNFINSTVISSGVPTGVAPTIITVESDYAEAGKRIFLDSGHFLNYYKSTDGTFKFKTYSITTDTITLIDTFVCPVSYKRIWDLCKKDSKNIMGEMLKPDSTPQHAGLVSVGLASDWTINGVSPVQEAPSSIRRQPRYSGTGNVFNLEGNLGGVINRSTYTVNAYSTVPFVYAGMTTAAASSGSTPVTIGGISSGHSGLTIGADYFIKDTLDGELTALAGSSNGTRIGKAISATEILLGDVT